ncbi:uncharacterized protein LOC125054581 [Pieris napi]|uniref:uncharacterized protein LOC125054581 n=1 Tax=Pieris napi TaxID=78633 RepID=UPI001FBB65F9|nr:uncharacterized protein LOC125054581 [Pieris napi]
MKVRSQITISCIFILIQLSYTARIKRAHSDNFNVLLNIYKMNPLKHSDVFKKFSNQILLPRPDGTHDVNPNSYESGKEKGILKSANPTLDTNDYQYPNITNNTRAIHSKDNDVINVIDDGINDTSMVSTIKKKKVHYHLFNDENEDLNKFNEINNQDADTIIM